MVPVVDPTAFEREVASHLPAGSRVASAGAQGACSSGHEPGFADGAAGGRFAVAWDPA